MCAREKKTDDVFEVFVFRTSLQTPVEVRVLSGILDNTPGILKWNVDLEDWEKILRVESGGSQPGKSLPCLAG